MAQKFAQLEGMTREQLVELYDSISDNVTIGLDSVRLEIGRRDQGVADKRMLTLTNRIWWLTAVVTAATLVNVGIFIASLK